MIGIMTSRKTRQTTDFLFHVILKIFSVNPILVKKCEFVSFRKNESRLIQNVSIY